TLLVAAGAVGVAVSGVHQLLEGFGVAFAEQVAGFLPTENVARRHAPRRAVEFLIAGEEIEEHAGMRQIPALALAERKDLAEQLLGLAAVEEVRLVRRPLIGIARRYRDADAQVLRQVEEGRYILGRVAVIDRAIDVDGKAFGLGGLDGADRLFEAAFHADRFVVVML